MCQITAASIPRDGTTITVQRNGKRIHISADEYARGKWAYVVGTVGDVHSSVTVMSVAEVRAEVEFQAADHA